jgi:hypothetical protein
MTAILQIAMLTALLGAPVAAQQPAEAPAPAEVPRTRLRGRVLDARSNQPVKGARVVIGDRGGVMAESETDFEGRFDIPDAPTGEQSIEVHKSAYTAKRQRIRIPAGRELEGVRIEMHRTAAISGRVTDAGGSPLPGVSVRVVHRVYSDGVPTYMTAASRMFGGAATDDRGWFRAWGLAPGAYIVAVVPTAEPGPRGQTVFSASGLYYPNAPSVAEAARVRVDWDRPPTPASMAS